MKKFFGYCLAALFVSGCWTTQNVKMADASEFQQEGSVVITRGKSFVLVFGSQSPWKYFEVMYERFSLNENGQPVVDVGIRYKGGDSWTDWWDSAPSTVRMGAQCSFYQQKGAPAIYSTNREQIVFRRGETFAYRAVSPVKGAQNFQLVLGE